MSMIITDKDFNKKEYNSTTICSNKNVVWIEHNNLRKFDNLRHAYSTRIGGVSKGCCESMNLRNCEWDTVENYRQNMEIFCDAAGFDFDRIVATHQTHTTNVEVVADTDVPKGSLFATHYMDVDGIVTNVKGVTLVASFADCIPLYFYDPVREAIGICHSGWKGTLGKIGAVTITKMVENYGCNPQDIIVAIGPGICSDCYEVSEDLYDEFSASWSREAVDNSFTKGREGHYQLDLWKANYYVMIEANINPANISVTDICTKCNSDKLFSHRAQGAQRGNQCGFMMLV